MSPRPDQPDDPMPDPTEGQPAAGAAERIIEKFGGIRPMAHKLEIPVTTVQGWKKRGAIPAARHADLLAAAARHAIPLDPEELAAAAPSEEPAGDAAAETLTPQDSPEAARDSGKTGGGSRPVEERMGEPAGELADEPAADAPLLSSRPVADDTTAPGNGAASGHAPAMPSRSTGVRTLAVAATVLSVLALGTALTSPWWVDDLLTPALGEPRRPAAVATLEARVNDLATRLEAAAGPGGGPQATDTTALAETVSALETRLAEVAETARRVEEQVSGSEAGNGEALAARIAEVERGLEERLTELASRLPDQPVDAAQLEQQIGQQVEPLRRQLQQIAGEVEQIRPLQAALERNAQAVAALETEANRLAGELSGASQRVAGLADAVERRQTADADTQALVLAAGQLRAALQGSGGFAEELRTLRQLGLDDGDISEAVAELAAHADEGIPTRPQLADRFSRLAPDIVRAERTASGGAWYDQALDRVSSLVSVRRVGGGVSGDDAGAVVARTEAQIEDDDLDGAVAELAALQGPAAQAADPWLAQARARLLADRTSAALTRHAIGRLAGFRTSDGGSNASSDATSNALEGGTVQQ